jgi:Protein of unknown function (DUF1345)
VLPHIRIRIDDWVLVPVTLSILLSCWALSLVSFALHYAQYDLETPGLDFPSDRTHAFSDYKYFSIAVATTFGATDVNITSPRMRRVVNLHTILTFRLQLGDRRAARGAAHSVMSGRFLQLPAGASGTRLAARAGVRRAVHERMAANGRAAA